MAQVILAVPGDLDAPTGGYAYARRLVELLPGEGLAVRPLALPAAYPDPQLADLDATAGLIAATPADAVLLIDGLAFGAMPPGLIAGFRRPLVALVHHPLGHESGLPPARRAALLASERAALALADRVVAASALTARTLQGEFGVPAGRIAVAEPGTERAPRACGTGRPVNLLAVGAVSPRKGFDILVRALAGLADLDWRATVAGSLDRDPAASAALSAAIAESGLAGHVALAGAVDAATLERLYGRTDILVSASLHEGYGMVLAEAMAHGLPLVVAAGGAAAETVPDAAALKAPPGDAHALRAALRRLITEPDLRARLADASWRAGLRLPRWRDTAARVAAVLKEVAR